MVKYIYEVNIMDKIKNRMNELIEIINKAIYEYYILDNPTITDQEYDDAYVELLRLEKEYPELKIVVSVSATKEDLPKYIAKYVK